MIVGIHHASLLISDLERARRFYQDVLGLPPAERPELGFPGLWFQAGQQQIHLLCLPENINTREGHGGRDYHVALAVDSLAPLRERLEHADIPYTESRSGRDALFCRDPDGNAIELIVVEKR